MTNLYEHHSGERPQYLNKALKYGYSITHIGLLLNIIRSRLALVLASRCSLDYNTILCVLGYVVQKKKNLPMNHLLRKNFSALEWDRSCSHDSKPFNRWRKEILEQAALKIYEQNHTVVTHHGRMTICSEFSRINSSRAKKIEIIISMLNLQRLVDHVSSRNADHASSKDVEADIYSVSLIIESMANHSIRPEKKPSG